MRILRKLLAVIDPIGFGRSAFRDGGTFAPRLDLPRHGMAFVAGIIRRMFPRVSQLSPRELAKWLSDSNRDRPQLLDVRTREEFAVSLPGARRVEPTARAEHVKRMLDPDRPVVVYCAGGYRSSKLAERLIRAGVANVHNLEGAIFAWANQGLPLECDGKPATTIHTCGRLGGILVKAERRCFSSIPRDPRCDARRD